MTWTGRQYPEYSRTAAGRSPHGHGMFNISGHGSGFDWPLRGGYGAGYGYNGRGGGSKTP